MTQEDKDLLFKDICGRLPYGVIVQSTFYYCDGTIWKYENETLTSKLLNYTISRYKPYLLPMSNMTEEQYKTYCELEHSGNMEHLSLPLLEWLNKSHFDYRGLIEKGLAIDATNLNIY